MLLSVVFVITYIVALVAFALLLGGSTLLQRLPIAFFLQLAILCLGAGACSFVGVKLGLVLPIILNCALAAACILFSRRTKERGESGGSRIVVADATDIVAFALIAALVVVCAWRQFGTGMTPYYITVDASVHARAAMAIVNGGPISGMYFTHYFDALCVMAIQPFCSSFDSYRGCLVAEVIMLYFGAVAFYALVKNAETRLKSAVSVALSLLYFGGYLLIAHILGHEYLGPGVSLISVLLFVVLRKDDAGVKWLYYSFVALTLFGVLVCYPIFVPIAFGPVLIELLFTVREKGVSPVKIIVGICAIILVCVLGYFLVYRAIFGGDRSIFGVLSTDGGSYANLYGNFVFIAPATIYGIVALWARRHEMRFLYAFAVVLLVFEIAMACLCIAGKVSEYYFYKGHYVLWLLVFIFAAYGLYALLDRDRTFFAAYSCTWLVVFTLAVSGLDDKLVEKCPSFNPSPQSWSFFDVYHMNRIWLNERLLPREEVDLYREYDKLLGDTPDEATVLIAHPHSVGWFDAITGRRAVSADFWHGSTNSQVLLYSSEDIQKAVDNCDYILVVSTGFTRQSAFETSDGVSMNDLVEKYQDYGEVVFSNNCGAIIKIG